jgi:hypothetical protein
MEIDNTILIEIQDYIEKLNDIVGLTPETMDDIRQAISKYRKKMEQLPKNDRVYIRDWFSITESFKHGEYLWFVMSSFVSGEYKTKIYLDSDGDPYIHKCENFYDTCRNYFIVAK